MQVTRLAHSSKKKVLSFRVYSGHPDYAVSQNVCEFLLSTLTLHGNEVTDHNRMSQVVSMMVFGENVFWASGGFICCNIVSGCKAKLKA